MRKTVILDTNFLTIPVQFGVDIFEEIKKTLDFPFEIRIFEKTIYELENIGKGKTLNRPKYLDREAAKVALSLIKQKNLKTLHHPQKLVDDKILAYCKENKETVVGTLDRELQKKLKKLGISLLKLRQGKYLVLE